MSEFAQEIPADDHAAAIEALLLVKEWSQPAGRAYFMGSLQPDAHPLLEGCRRAFFLKIPPGGHIHRHTDGPAAHAFDTDLIVVETNEQSFVCWQDGDGEHRAQLELGKRYRVLGRDLPHWAFNYGDTDRAHLLIEYPKDF